MDRLTVKQEKFCVNYFKLGNATQAAILAGYSENSANEIAAENLTKPSIIERMNLLKQGYELGSILSVTQRKEKLSQIISKGELDPKSITPRDRISATSELNKMEHIYSEAPQVVHNTQTIFIIGRGYSDGKELLESPKPDLIKASNNVDTAIVK
jgi:phage terminase small subunit